MKPDQHLARLAARQYGLYTTDQALTAGLTSSALWRRRESGRVQRLEPEVYRAAGVPETWHQRLLIACLTEDAVASHRAAAALFALDGFPPRIVEVVTPGGSAVRTLPCGSTRAPTSGRHIAQSAAASRSRPSSGR